MRWNIKINKSKGNCFSSPVQSSTCDNYEMDGDPVHETSGSTELQLKPQCRRLCNHHYRAVWLSLLASPSIDLLWPEISRHGTDASAHRFPSSHHGTETEGQLVGDLSNHFLRSSSHDTEIRSEELRPDDPHPSVTSAELAPADQTRPEFRSKMKQCIIYICRLWMYVRHRIKYDALLAHVPVVHIFIFLEEWDTCLY